jgi:nucleoside-triphosphatase THEP1
MKCLKSLDVSISDCRSRRDELLAKRHADTCTWFFADTKYRDWVEDASDNNLLLWIPGAPGSGKSVLSAILTEEMASHGNNVAYFFCKDTDERLRSDSAILKHLLAQVLEQDPWIFHHFENEPDYRKDQEKTNWTSGMLWRIFEQIWTDSNLTPRRTTCLIIDAIGTSTLP